MDLKGLFDKYIENQNKLSTLKDAYLKQGLINQEILGEMVSIATLQRSLFEENETILNDTVYYYKKNKDEINDEVFKNLQGFANRLALLLNQKDTAIAFIIHELLLDYAYQKKNKDYIVQEAYYKGTILLYLDSELYLEEARETFCLVKAFKDDYFDLKRESRSLFNRAYANIYVTYCLTDFSNYQDIFLVSEEIYNFWMDERVQMNDLDFPFYRWIFLMKNNTLDIISTDIYDQGIEKKYVDYVLDCANEVYNHARTLVKDTSLPVEGICQFYYYAAKYYAKELSLKELLEKTELLTYPLPEDRYSFESRTRTIQISAFYIRFLDKMADKPKAHKLINETIKRVKNYISEMPFSNQERQISRDIESFINIVADKIDEKEAFKLILELTVYCHFPTYVHITMVANIALTILKYAINEIPNYFVGMQGINSVKDVFSYSHRLVDITYNASLLHDVGKFYCLDYIGNFGRKLTEREFNIIKSHPERGYALLKKAKIDEKYIEASLYHHIWYDGTNGYPKNKSIDNLLTKPIIDIISISDAIDAGTDTIGRPYAKGKTLDSLLDEFEAEAGTRYSSELVALLRMKDLNRELKELITIERENISIRTHKNFTSK
ncbi:HD domain-containing protein [Acholeplasma sp. OttesenSCG-928-E16]|nr:HD domain-containing protein [Acholeplasma sp. OttesenSCG-928-E16]